MTINNIRRAYKDFFTECPQLFALFNACDSSKEAAERALNRLSQDCRNKVFKKVYTTAGKPATTDAQWGEHNALEDLPRLQNALERIAHKIFGSLDISQQHLAEGLAYEHAGRLATDDPEWGKHHIADRGDLLLHTLADTQVLECVELWAKEVRAQHPGLDNSLAKVSTEICRFLTDSNATRLNLSELHLPSLPSVFDLEPFTTRLQQLYCSNNQLTELPREIGNCIALQELYCFENRLTKLPETLGDCTALQKLYCSNNQLTVLPSEIGNCTNLQILCCYYNWLRELPSQIGDLTALQNLECFSNQLAELPETLRNCTALRSLNCSGNQLAELPETLRNCTVLQSLACSGNRLRELPSQIGDLTALQYLNCSSNQLTALPAELLQLPQGCRVTITGCPLSEAVRRRLREATEQPNYQGPQIFFSMGGGVQRAARSIPESLKKLCEWAEEEPVKEFPALLGVDDASLRVWLSRLGDVHDCGRQELRRGCARTILEYLQLAQDNPSFRETFFAMIDEAAHSCGDRMAFFLLNLGVQHRLATADLRDSKELARLLIRGVWCLNQLQKIACDKVGRTPFVDEIEVYLIYPIRLREALDLPIDIRDMHFADLAGVSEEELTEAGLSVLTQLQNEEALCDFLITQPKWLEALELCYPAAYVTYRDEGDVDGMKALTRSFL